jgi:acyl-coenzyme A thioesterase PaaI-like protein
MKMISLISPYRLMKLLRFWPPFWAAGIRVSFLNKEFTQLTVTMVQRPWNTNYVGSHFGGSLYAMVDPFFMFMMIHHLGKDYVVWDKAAFIKFVSPGKGRVSATFRLSLEQIQEAKLRAKEEEKYEPVYRVEIFDESKKLVAYAEKTLFIKEKVKMKNGNQKRKV